MKYTVEYLLKQLEETNAIHKRYVKMLEVDSGNIAARIMVRSMSRHVAEIKRDLKEAQHSEASIATMPRKSESGKRLLKTAETANVVG
jgi:ubiquinone biosynthesis protein UbiJ